MIHVHLLFHAEHTLFDLVYLNVERIEYLVLL